MTRHFSVTHPDGTMSTRSSQNRVYPYAVEVTIDQHADAAKKQTEAAGYRARAAKADEPGVTFRHHDTGPWPASLGGGRRIHVEAYTETGEKITYVESYRTPAEPEPSEQNLRDELAEVRDTWLDNAHRLEAGAARMLEGPRYTYGVATWNSRLDLSEKAAASWRVPGHSTCVVETVEHDRRPKKGA